MSWFKTLHLRQQQLWWKLGCLSSALAVGIGAIGAHFVTPTERFEKTFKTGSQYHFAHSVALLFVSHSLPNNMNHWSRAGVLFTVGLFLFCGSLYAVAIAGDRSYGKLAPIGGMSFIFGWICLAIRK